MDIPIWAAREVVIELAEAYWIHPNGRIRAVKRTHIEDVIDLPITFGFSTKEIKSLYYEYREPLGFEGDARDVIIDRVIRAGWIRIRYVNDRGMWDVELRDLTLDAKDRLFGWACALIKAGNDSSVTVNIYKSTGKSDYPLCTAGSLAKDVLYTVNESQRTERKSIIPVMSTYSFLDVEPAILFEEWLAKQVAKEKNMQYLTK